MESNSDCQVRAGMRFFLIRQSINGNNGFGTYSAVKVNILGTARWSREAQQQVQVGCPAMQ
jgi:hypothetical protein